MRPLRPKAADEEYVIGQVYVLVEAPEERSVESHRHYFAALNDAWAHLPERLADLFPTPEHLRKRALIDAGYYNEVIIDAGSKAAALRVAAFVRGDDEFAVVVTRGPLVGVRKAKTQKFRMMPAAEFHASANAVMKRVAELIGVEQEDLGKVA
jgi:hypothetical protein